MMLLKRGPNWWMKRDSSSSLSLRSSSKTFAFLSCVPGQSSTRDLETPKRDNPRWAKVLNLLNLLSLLNRLSTLNILNILKSINILRMLNILEILDNLDILDILTILVLKPCRSLL